MGKQPTERFTDRVETYRKYRPSYPKAVVDWLDQITDFKKDWLVADIGSGTGISSRLFAAEGRTVIGVEPNKAMRESSEDFLSEYPHFSTSSGKAEKTGLPDDSVHLILVAQAFHWFDQEKTKKEFQRIAKPGAFCTIWINDRLREGAFHEELDKLVHRHAQEYTDAVKPRVNEVYLQEITAFFHPFPFVYKVFPNKQILDKEGLLGRIQSASYMPNEYQPGYDAMKEDLFALFDTHAVDGSVEIIYNLKVYCGRIK